MSSSERGASEREPSVFNKVFWNRFSSANKQLLIENIIKFSKTYEDIASSFFSPEQGINKLLQEVDDPNSSLDSNELMSIIYSNILAKSEVINQQSLSTILPMIIQRNRVTDELKIQFISELWNRLYQLNELAATKQDFLDILLESDLNPKLLNKLLLDNRLTTFKDFLYEVPAGFSTPYIDVLLQPYILKNPKRITAIIQTPIFEYLIENNNLGAWLQLESIKILCSQTTLIDPRVYGGCISRITQAVTNQEADTDNYIKSFAEILNHAITLQDAASIESIAELLKSIILKNKLSVLTDELVKQELTQQNLDSKSLVIDKLLDIISSGQITRDQINMILDNKFIVAKALSFHDVEKFKKWLSFYLQETHQNNKIEKIFSLINKVYDIYKTPQEIKQLITNFMLTLNYGEKQTFFTESNILLILALQYDIPVLLENIEYGRLWLNITENEPRPRINSSGRVHPYDVMKISCFYNYNRSPETIEQQQLLFIDKLAKAVLKNEQNLPNLFRLFNTEKGYYEHRFRSSWGGLSRPKYLCSFILITKLFQLDFKKTLSYLSQEQFLVNFTAELTTSAKITEEINKKWQEVSTDKNLILSFIVTSINYEELKIKDLMKEILRNLMKIDSNFHHALIAYLQQTGNTKTQTCIRILNALDPNSQTKFIQRLISVAFKDTLTLLMSPTTITKVTTMPLVYEHIKQSIINIWPTLNSASSAVLTDIDKNFILSCLVQSNINTNPAMETFLAQTLNKLINIDPTFVTTLINYIQTTQPNMQYMLLKIVDQEPAETRNALCNTLIKSLINPSDLTVNQETIQQLANKINIAQIVQSGGDLFGCLLLISPYINNEDKLRLINEIIYSTKDRDFTKNPISLEPNAAWILLTYMLNCPKVETKKPFVAPPVIQELLKQNESNQFLQNLVIIRKNAATKEYAKKSLIDNIYQYAKTTRAFSQLPRRAEWESYAVNVIHNDQRSNEIILNPTALPIPVANLAPASSRGLFSPFRREPAATEATLLSPLPEAAPAAASEEITVVPDNPKSTVTVEINPQPSAPEMPRFMFSNIFSRKPNSSTKTPKDQQDLNEKGPNK